jgi:hypothetical protein
MLVLRFGSMHIKTDSFHFLASVSSYVELKIDHFSNLARISITTHWCSCKKSRMNVQRTSGHNSSSARFCVDLPDNHDDNAGNCVEKNGI